MRSIGHSIRCKPSTLISIFTNWELSSGNMKKMFTVIPPAGCTEVCRLIVLWRSGALRGIGGNPPGLTRALSQFLATLTKYEEREFYADKTGTDAIARHGRATL